MPECHTCRHRPKPGTDWRRSACRRCTLPDTPSHKCRTHVDIDGHENRDVESLILPEADPRRQDHADGRRPLRPALLKVTAALLAMPPVAREILLFRVARPDAPLREIAARLSITVQAAHDALHRVRRKHAFVARIIPAPHHRARSKQP